MQTATRAIGAQVSEHESLASLVQESRSRAYSYRLIARLYRREVDQAFLDTLAHIDTEPMARDTSQMTRGLIAIVDYARSAGKDDVLVELAVDYARTFIGNGTNGHEAAYPFESVYLSEKHLMMQAPRDEVRAIYLSAGLDRSEDWSVGEDHMALELEFMGILADRCADAAEQGEAQEVERLLATQKAFLHNHIAAWGQGLTTDMRRCARTAFYQGTADMTDGFLLADLAYLDEV